MIKKTIRFIASPLLIAGRVISADVHGARGRLHSLLAGYTPSSSAVEYEDFISVCEALKRKESMSDEQLQSHLLALSERLRRRSRLLYCAMLLGAIYASFLAWSGLILASLTVLLWSFVMGIVAARCAMKVRQIEQRALFSFAKFVEDNKYFV